MAVGERPHYLVRAERDDRWWFLRVPEIPGVFSQVRRLEHAEDMARDAIALAREVPADSFDVEVMPFLEGELDDAVRRAKQRRADAIAAEQMAKAAARRAIRHLTGAGYSMRDIGRLLGLSFQRVAQLAQEAAKGVYLDEAVFMGEEIDVREAPTRNSTDVDVEVWSEIIDDHERPVRERE